jgi:hypothetical protein
MPENDGLNLLRVSNGHSARQETTMRYTLTVDLIGSTVTVTFTADSPNQAMVLAAQAYPEARSISLEYAEPAVVAV